MTRRFSSTMALSMLVAWCACSAPVPHLHDFNGVRRVVITGLGGGDTPRALSAPDSLAALVAFVNARNSDWERPWSGVPVPQVTAFFYGADFQGSFGGGPGFFETQRAGTFASRAASEAELAEFARLVGVPTERVLGQRR
jgi:hypothetical protein